MTWIWLDTNAVWLVCNCALRHTTLCFWFAAAAQTVWKQHHAANSSLGSGRLRTGMAVWSSTARRSLRARTHFVWSNTLVPQMFLRWYWVFVLALQTLYSPYYYVVILDWYFKKGRRFNPVYCLRIFLYIKYLVY